MILSVAVTEAAAYRSFCSGEKSMLSKPAPVGMESSNFPSFLASDLDLGLSHAQKISRFGKPESRPVVNHDVGHRQIRCPDPVQKDRCEPQPLCRSWQESGSCLDQLA